MEEVVTLRKVYDELIALRVQMSPVPAMVTDHEAQLRLLRGLPEDVTDHEARLRIVERRMWWLAGAAAVLGALGNEWIPAIFGG